MKAGHLFYLRKKVGSVYHYYKINSTGSVELSEAKQPITEPMNWESIEIGVIRNSVYRGVVANDSLPVEFVLDGAEIVKQLYIEDNRQAEAELYIEYLESLQYHPLTSGMLDFAKYAPIMLESPRVVVGYSVPVYGDDLHAKLDAYKDMKITLDVNSLSPFRVYAPGKEVNTLYSWIAAEVNWSDAPYGVGPGVEVFMAANEAARRGNIAGLVQNTISPPPNYPAENPNQSLQFLFHTTRDCRVTFSGQFDLYHEAFAGDPTKLEMLVSVFSGNNLMEQNSGAINPRFEESIWTDSTFTPVGHFRNVTAVIDKTIDFLQDDFVFIRVKGLKDGSDNGTTHKFKIHSGWELKANCEFTLRESLIKANSFENILRHLIENITEGTHTAQSNWSKSTASRVDMIPKNLMLSCGDSVRGLLTPKLHISLNELLDIATAIDNIGIGVYQDKVRLEDLGFFFNKHSLIYDIGEAQYVNAPYPYEGAFAGQIEIGYPDVDGTDYDTRDEFNTTHVYKTDQTKSNDKTTWKCPAIAAHTVIDPMRVTLTSRDDNSTKEDKSLFLLYTTGQQQNVTLNGVTTPAYPLQLGAGHTVSGVTYPDTTYNIPLSPTRCMYRKTPFLKSLLYTKSGRFQNVKFKGAGKPVTLVSNMGSGQVTEGTDTNFHTRQGDLLFKPYLFELEQVKNAAAIMRAIKANPYGFIRFRKKGVVFEGFIMKATYNPTRQRVISMALLAAPSVDVTQFHVFDEVQPRKVKYSPSDIRNDAILPTI